MARVIYTQHRGFARLEDADDIDGTSTKPSQRQIDGAGVNLQVILQQTGNGSGAGHRSGAGDFWSLDNPCALSLAECFGSNRTVTKIPKPLLRRVATLTNFAGSD